ncbi:hypothetical protein [Legionella nagasakiensis]|uniref:hypothetical protein n=1 Tax=Legionella nagasakiensis TaxID=535290 RepID=UPI001054EE98|nr:hypothetical protein [Legionella nagasakiensis]
MPDIKQPLAKNHYEYLNELLGKEGDRALSAKKEMEDAEARALAEKVRVKLIEMEARLVSESTNQDLKDNITKMKRVLEFLQSEEKRSSYNAAISTSVSSATVQTKVEGQAKSMAIVPLVPIKEIIDEFDDIKKQMNGQDKPGGGGKYKETDFSYRTEEGPPKVHVFIFPDEASANAFIERLFNKNMAMLPNGSQDMKDVKKGWQQQATAQQTTGMKGALGAIKQEAERGALEAASDSPDVTSTTPRLGRST